MLMVANEFAELQTQRVTYPPFTLLMLVGGWGRVGGLHQPLRLQEFKPTSLSS
jgi:hypothetical protein